MFKQIKRIIVGILTLLMLTSYFAVSAQPGQAPQNDNSAYDLINAVNALRASYGLPAYSINSILMFTAQNQADFMSANGVVIHTGPGGSTVTQRLLAAGYPLAGDLSLGGYRSENIIAINVNQSAEDAVSAWMDDAPHQYTMLSPDLTEIGGGVAVVNGLVYFVIDCARPTTNGAPQASTPFVGSGATVPVNEAVGYPVLLSTPNANGDVVHEVQAGQTLWQIAISYGVKIDEIKRLNNLFDNNIYPGNKLLIKKEITPTAQPPITLAPELTATPFPATTSQPTMTMTVTQVPVIAVPQDNERVIKVALVIIALAVLGGGFVAWRGSAGQNSG